MYEIRVCSVQCPLSETMSLAARTAVIPPRCLRVPELWDEIIQNLLPARSPAIQDGRPLYFPSKRRRPGTAFLGIALTCKFLHSITMNRARLHVVVASGSALHGLIQSGEREPALYSQTTHCDIFHDIDATPDDFVRLLSLFPKLHTLAWEYPSLAHFRCLEDASLPNISRVVNLLVYQLPSGFSTLDLLGLSASFSHLCTLLVCEAPVVFAVSCAVATDDPFLARLSRLDVGTQRQFLPGDQENGCALLKLFGMIAPRSVCPAIEQLWIGSGASGVGEFLRTHGRSLRTVSMGTAYALSGVALDTISAQGQQVNTFVYIVDAVRTVSPALPPSIRRVVLALPILPFWRVVPSMRAKIILSVDMVKSLIGGLLDEVVVDDHGYFEEWWWVEQQEYFQSRGVLFRRVCLGNFFFAFSLGHI